MDYKGFRVSETKGGIMVENIVDFHPVHIFECGQCFRWYKQEDGSYTGVAGGKVVNLKYRDGTVILDNATVQDFTDFWYDYLDLGTDYSSIKNALMKDDIMAQAIKSGYGIRLLKQDIWETLISFIISANNRIPRIMKTIDIISKIYGEEIEYNQRKYYSFPAVDRLTDTSIEELEVCKGGFRCKYIHQTAHMIKSGMVNLKGLDKMSTDEAREELMRLRGVGPKVADCILLFSGTKSDVFPTDVWVKRVMEELYFKREASLKEIQDFAGSYFGSLKGIAQQYLFYYARENRIGAR